jgi:2-polyprenyl-3-methyl-5-hydroxy-6-metoxy-1,4-benzoquinol methylase
VQFEKAYFHSRKYKLKENVVKCHILEVVNWASKILRYNLFDGQGKKSLDVGCAYGYASKVFETLGYEAYGVDVSRWGIKQAKQNSIGHFLICDVQTKLPFKAETFNLVTCFDVLEHLPFPEKAIQNMLGICEGVMICTTPNKAIEKPVRKIIQDFDETHINVRFPSEWEKFINDKDNHALVKMETFYDLPVTFANRIIFFKSFRVPRWGLTLRILVKK